jgi:hypothetical protein
MPGGKSALSSMGKAQRELAQGVQPPRGELKPVYGVADAPCRFETPCLTRPPRAMRVVLPRIGLHRCTMTDDQLLLTPSRFLIRPGLNGAYPSRTTPNPIAARVAKPPQRFSFESLPYPRSGRAPCSRPH